MENNLYLCSVDFNDNCLFPFLGTRIKDKGLFYFKHVDKSYRWGVELQFIKKNKLGKIKLYEEMRYQNQKIFSQFASELYKRRKSEVGNPHLQIFFKMVLNSLYGKFCQKEYGEVHYMHKDNMNEYVQNPFIHSIDEIATDIFRIEYNVSKNLDFLGSLVRFSAKLTAIARVNLMTAILSAGQKNVYYHDTDSFISNHPIEDKSLVGQELGQWKLEMDQIEGWFFGNKIYRLKGRLYNKDGSIIYDKYENHCKGVRQNQLTQGFWENLLQNKQTEIINESVFKRFPGYVNVEQQMKLVSIVRNRRKWSLNETSSVPFNDLQQYYNENENLKQQTVQ